MLRVMMKTMIFFLLLVQYISCQGINVDNAPNLPQWSGRMADLFRPQLARTRRNTQESSSAAPDPDCGGKDDKRGAFPWMVMITKNHSPVCTGLIIDRQRVLSAAHCYKDFEVDTYHIVFEGKSHSVRRIQVHEHYVAGSTDNDIALLTMTNDVCPKKRR